MQTDSKDNFTSVLILNVPVVNSALENIILHNKQVKLDKLCDIIVMMSCYWASEASPTLGCSIEISRDIYIYVCLSYVKSRGIT